MNRLFNNIKLLIRFGFEGLILLFVFNTNLVSGQGFGEKNNIYIIGQVTNQLNGGPVKEQEIIIISDTLYSPQFAYQTIVYTDCEGYFYDTISTYLNKGALVISTIDYQNNHYDTTVYFRFNWSNENVLFANFILPTEPPQILYQANFYYLRNPSGGNTSEYQFFDITNSTDIILREWDFGDGNFSSEMNPTHEYMSTGVYRVTLTVTIASLPGVAPYVSIMVKILNVTIKNYFYLGGHVMGGYFPIDYGEAFLYKIENTDIVLIDTAVFNDTLGYYLFYQVIEGDYLVKADLCSNSVLFNQFLTTYYSNKPIWTEADTIHHYENWCEYDISLIPVTQTYNGAGTISGSISYGFDEINGKGIPAANIEILLLDENNVPSICCHSSEDGLFSFENLDLGTYNVHPEVTGKYTFPVQVILNEQSPASIEVSLTIGNYTVGGSVNGISLNDWTEKVGQPYPNPASDYISIDFEIPATDEILVSLYSNTGQLMKNFLQPYTGVNNNVSVDIRYLNTGIYLIKLSSDGEETVKKFIKR